MAGFEGIKWADFQSRYLLQGKSFAMVPMADKVPAVSRSIHYGLCLAFEGIRYFVGPTEDGGLHIQFNIMSYEMLIDAKAHPENYPELLVRVSGYSAYFKDLNDAMKDEIITRTAYDLKTGKAAAFPEQHKGMLPST